MHWTAILGLVAFFGLQAAFVGATLYAYNRIRSQQDSQGQERIQWGFKVEAAMSQADSAMKKAESIETAHFGKLRALFEAQALELSDARARIMSLEKELKVCQMKLASEERINRRDEKRRAKEDPPDPEGENAAVPGAPGGDVDSLLRQLGTKLNGQPPAAPAAPTKPPGFGQVVR